MSTPPSSQSPWSEQKPLTSTSSPPASSSDPSSERAVDFRSASVSDRFGHPTYLLQKQFWKMFGGAFRFYDPNGNLVFYSKQKAFRLKEDIRLFTGEDMTHEVLSIQARRVLDFSATYDVVDSPSGQKIGALRRKGLKSMLQDEWLFLDPLDREIGAIREDSTAQAVIRRLIEYAAYFMPQSFHGYIGNHLVCVFKQTFNPFVGKINLDFSADTSGLLDRRLGIAAAVLLCAIEGKQH